MAIPPGSLQNSYDFSDPACYPGSGSTVFDLEGSLDLPISGPTFISNGNSSYFQFSGSSNYIGLSSGVSGFGNTFSISIWAQSSSNLVQVLFFAGNDAISSAAPAYYYNLPTSGSISGSFNYGTGLITEPFVTDTWENYIYTADGTTAKLYKNGVLQGSISQGSGNWPTGQFYLGYPTDALIGRIALVDVYNVSLDAGDILDLYNLQKSRFPIISYDFSDAACYPGSGSTVFDLSGSGINASISGVTFSGTGQSKYFQFNGNVGTDVISSSVPTGSFSGFTFNLWCMPENSSVENILMSFGNDGPGTIPFIDYSLFTPSKFLISNGFGVGTTEANVISPINEWAMVTYSYTPTSCKIYLDGTLAGTVSGTVNPADPSPFRLGQYATGGPADNFYGRIAIAEVYNVGLGSTEITDLYNSQAARFFPPITLVASYDFSDPLCYPGSGTTVFDLAGSLDLQIAGTVAYSGTGQSKFFDLGAGATNGNYIGTTGVTGLGNTFTISGWARNKGSAGYPLFTAGYESPSGTAPGFYYPTVSTVAGHFNYGVNFTDGPCVDNTWNFLTYTVDGTTCKLYVNGILVDSIGKAGGSEWATGAFVFGAAVTGGGGINAPNYITADIATFDVYNVALGSTAVLDIYNSQESRFITPTPPAPPALIGSYDFSDPTCWPGTGNTVFDLTAENNDLQVIATTFGGTGQSKYAAFNGDTTYLYRSQFSASGSTFSSDEFTLSLWHNYANPQQSNAIMIMGGNGGAGQGIQLQVTGSDSDKITAAFGIEITEGGQLSGIANTSNTWHMSTVTGDGSLLKLYQDGAFIGSTTQAGSWDPRAFIIGRGLGSSYQPSPVGPGFRYTGLIGIAEVYSGALGSTDISDLYDLQSPRFAEAPPPSNLVNSYDFSDPACYPGTGNTVFDLTGNNLDLPIVNASYVGSGSSSHFHFTGSGEYIGKTGVTGFGSTFTINMWARQNENNTLYHSFNGGYVNNGPAMYWNDGAAGNIAPSFNSGNNKIVASGIATSEWYLTSYVLDGTTAKLYINGSLIGSVSQAPGILWQNGVFVLAAATDGAGNIEPAGYFVGDIATFDVYNEALDSSTITDIYDNTENRFIPAPPPAPPSNVGGRQFAQGFNG
jgi:hypothetical protein